MIRNQKDLRTTVSMIRFAEKNGTGEEVANMVIDMKRDVRKYRRRGDDRRVIHDYGIDGGVLKIRLPEGIKTRLEAEDWFAMNEYIQFEPAPWDCSGRAFTGWYKLVKSSDGWVCYHRVCMDI